MAVDVGGKRSEKASRVLEQMMGSSAPSAGPDFSGGFVSDLKARVGQVAANPAGNALFKTLEVFDLARSVSLSTLIELSDIIVEPGDVSAKDWWNQAVGKDRFRGVGDLIEGNEWAAEHMPMNLKRALGFLGDVGTDPLTYLTWGAGRIAGAAGKAGAKASKAAKAAKAADSVSDGGRAVSFAEELGDAAVASRASDSTRLNGLAREIADAGKVVGESSLSRRATRGSVFKREFVSDLLSDGPWAKLVAHYGQREAENVANYLAKIGVPGLDKYPAVRSMLSQELRSGISFGVRNKRIFIPKTERPARLLTEITNKALDKSIRRVGVKPVQEVFPGFRHMRGSHKVDGKLVPNVENGWLKAANLERVARAGNTIEQVVRTQMDDELEQIARRVGVLDDKGRSRLRQGIEADDFDIAGVAEFREFFDAAVDSLEQVGIIVPKLKGYLPRQFSKQMREVYRNGGRAGVKGNAKAQAAAGLIERRYKAGTKFMGETLDGKRGIDEIHDILKAKLGDDYVQMFVEDPFAIAKTYTREVAQRVAHAEMLNHLDRLGMTSREIVGIRDYLKIPDGTRSAHGVAEASRVADEALEAEESRLLGVIDEQAEAKGAAQRQVVDAEKAQGVAPSLERTQAKGAKASERLAENESELARLVSERDDLVAKRAELGSLIEDMLSKGDAAVPDAADVAKVRKAAESRLSKLTKDLEETKKAIEQREKWLASNGASKKAVAKGAKELDEASVKASQAADELEINVRVANDAAEQAKRAHADANLEVKATKSQIDEAKSGVEQARAEAAERLRQQADESPVAAVSGGQADIAGRQELPPLLAESDTAEDMRALFDADDPADALATNLGRDVSRLQVQEAQSQVAKRTQQSLRDRGLPEEFVVWRVTGDEAVGGADEVLSVSLSDQMGKTFRGELTPYTVSRKDVLVDSNAFYQRGFVGEEELLVRRGALRTAADPKADIAGRQKLVDAVQEADKAVDELQVTVDDLTAQAADLPMGARRSRVLADLERIVGDAGNARSGAKKVEGVRSTPMGEARSKARKAREALDSYDADLAKRGGDLDVVPFEAGMREHPGYIFVDVVEGGKKGTWKGDLAIVDSEIDGVSIGLKGLADEAALDPRVQKITMEAEPLAWADDAAVDAALTKSRLDAMAERSGGWKFTSSATAENPKFVWERSVAQPSAEVPVVKQVSAEMIDADPAVRAAQARLSQAEADLVARRQASKQAREAKDAARDQAVKAKAAAATARNEAEDLIRRASKRAKVESPVAPKPTNAPSKAEVADIRANILETEQQLREMETMLFEDSAASARKADPAEGVARVQDKIDQIDERLSELRGSGGEVDLAQRRARRAAASQKRYLDEAEELWTAAGLEGDPNLKHVAVLEAQAAEGAAAMEALTDGIKATDQEWRQLLGQRIDKKAYYDQVERGHTELLKGRGGNRMGTEEAAKFLDTWSKLREPQNAGFFLNLYDQTLSRWKGYSLLSPGFHSRNFMGAVFNNWLDSVTIKSYITYNKAMHKVKKAGLKEYGYKHAIANADISDDLKQIFTEMYENETFMVRGARNENVRDVYDADVFSKERHRYGVARRVVKSGTKRSKVMQYIDPFDMDNLPLQWNHALAGGVEREVRAVQYLDNRLRGLSATQSAEKVRKFHFDYSELSQFEMKVMRRVFPFYTWTRKNFPLQIEMIARKPGRYTAYMHAHRNIQLGLEEEEVVPAYYAQMMGIQTPAVVGPGGLRPQEGDPTAAAGEPGLSRIYLTADTPFRDISKAFDVEGILGMTSPVIKIPLEVAAGKQFFSGIPFQDRPVEAPDYKVGPISFSSVIYPVLAELDGSFGLPRVWRGEDGQWMQREVDKYKIESAQPLLRRLASVSSQDERFSNRQLQYWLSTVAGINIQINDSAAQYGESLRRQQAVDKALGKTRGR